MSKVYENYLEMEELNCDAEYQEWLCKQQFLSDQDLNELEYENMEDCKAHEFAKKILEE